MALSDDKLWHLWNAQGTDDMSRAEAFVFARAIEAEVRKDDDALILQLVEALEKAESVYHANDTHPIAKRQASAAITAGRARLEGKR